MPRKGEPGGKHTGRWVAYYRASTDKQGKSGLGLEAQKAAVASYLNGGQWTLVGEFTEVESGRKQKKRPRLDEALTACKKLKAKLIVAKLDRLARNVAFISALMESSVEFVAADMPFANRLNLHIMAAFAEHEGEQISNRTRDALAAAKARGVKLGGPNIREAAQIGAQSNRAAADQFAANLAPLIREATEQRGDDLSRDRARANAPGHQDSKGRAVDPRAGVQHPQAHGGQRMTYNGLIWLWW